MVFAIALSGLVALTLTPMLCAKMLKKQTGRNRLNEIVDHINESLVNLYLPMLKWSIHHRKTMVIISVLCILSMFPMLGIVGGEFFPQGNSSRRKTAAKYKLTWKPPWAPATRTPKKF